MNKLEILKCLTENNKQIIELKEKIKRVKDHYSSFYDYHNVQLTNIIISELTNVKNVDVNNWKIFIENYRNKPALLSLIQEMIDSFDIDDKALDELIENEIEEHYNKYLRNKKYDYISPTIQLFLSGGYSNYMYDSAIDGIKNYMESEYKYKLKEFILGKDEYSLDLNMYTEQLKLLEDFNFELKKELEKIK